MKVRVTVIQYESNVTSGEQHEIEVFGVVRRIEIIDGDKVKVVYRGRGVR